MLRQIGLKDQIQSTESSRINQIGLKDQNQSTESIPTLVSPFALYLQINTQRPITISFIFKKG